MSAYAYSMRVFRRHTGVRGLRLGAAGALRAALAALCVIALIWRGCTAGDTQEEDMPAQVYDEVTLYDARGGATLVLPLEEYIFGVVAAEMPASFAPEALMAQAVAARTYTVRRLEEFGGEACGDHGADICSDSACCQAWRSAQALNERWGESAAFYTQKLREAVSATAGVVALYEGEPIEALYHSASGGATEAARDVFGGDVPYLVSVTSPGEENASHYKDEFTYTYEEFASLVNEAYPAAKLRARKLSAQLEVLSRAPGGRVTAMRAGDTVLTGRQLRGALSLPSAAFTLELDGGEVTLVTRGSGHGVGMSQYGADAMAREGAGYEEILKHYYTGISLGTLDEIRR